MGRRGAGGGGDSDTVSVIDLKAAPPRVVETVTRLVPLAAAWIGQWSQGIAFSADSKTILVQNMVEKEIQVLRWDGKTLSDSGHRIKTNGGPAAIRIATP